MWRGSGQAVVRKQVQSLDSPANVAARCSSSPSLLRIAGPRDCDRQGIHGREAEW
jgi:hypothetical protein